jgi:UDP:flavonoid glycosyltransferase YjiC (YdhE family)
MRSSNNLRSWRSVLTVVYKWTETLVEGDGTAMKFAMASYGTRGDVEPSIAVGRELMRRGHDVTMAVPPDLVAFAESVGLTALAYGTHVAPQLETYRDLWSSWTRRPWRVHDLVRMCRQTLEIVTRQWADVSATLMSFAAEADVLSTTVGYEQPAVNVAEYYDIPLVALHTFPWRPNGQLFPPVPPVLARFGMTAYDWLAWQLMRKYEDAQRRDLDLPSARASAPQRIVARGSLEIQAYDEVCVPGLAAEWANRGGLRPFVGALTMELPAQADEEATAWIASGSPPICFAMGSIPVESPAQTVELMGGAAAQLGARALICAGGTDFSGVAIPGHVKVVSEVSYPTVFAASRAVVHHGGSGTIAASLRAGVPTLALWTAGDQPFWGIQLRRLKAGTARRFTATSQETLVADLRRILTADYVARAREVATHMTEPRDSVTNAADLMERFAAEGLRSRDHRNRAN